MHDKLNLAWTGHQPTLPHHVATADDRHRHDGQPRLYRQQKETSLKASHLPIYAACALRKHDERVPPGS